MLFWNLEPSLIRRPEYVGADPTQRATWLNVGLYSVEQENGGIVRDAREWGDRRWMQTCGVTREEVNNASPLLVWEGNDLRVWFYPADKESQVRDGRTYGAIGGKKSGEVRRAKALAKGETNPPSTPLQQTPLTPNHEAPLNGKERKGKERKGKERKEKESPIVPTGTQTQSGDPALNHNDGRQPASFEILAAYVAQIGGTEEVARDIFDHYRANGWRQGGRAALASWQAAASKWTRGWLRDQAAYGSKNSPVLVAPAGAPVAATALEVCIPDGDEGGAA